MPTYRTLTIAARWGAIAAVAACSSAPDAAVSPTVGDPALGLGDIGCATTTAVVLNVGVAKRLTDKEASCLKFKSIQGSRYLLAYVDTRLVAKAQQGAESPLPDSAIVKVQDVSSSPFPTVVAADVPAPEVGPVEQHHAAALMPPNTLPANCPLLNTFYPFCRATPYRIGESITHYPGGGRPEGPAHILTVFSNLAIAVFDADAAPLVPNARARADSALSSIVKRNLPLLLRTFSLANYTSTSDLSGQLYIALQTASLSSAAWWPDPAVGHGRWARVTISLSPTSAFGGASYSYTTALQVLGHETAHTYQYRWRYEHASPWLTVPGTTWAVEGGASFIAQEMIREQLGIAFTGNTLFSASGPEDPAFPLATYGFRVRNFTSGYADGASLLRDLVQRLVGAGMTFDAAMQLVLLGAMEGWYGINEENQQHGLGLTQRMRQVLGAKWTPTEALLQWTMSEAADDLTSNATYQNLTKRAINPSTTTNNIRPEAVISPGSSVSVSRAPGTTGVFEIAGSTGATYRATSNIVKNGVTPIEWLLLRIQ